MEREDERTGSAGGKARSEKLSAEERSRIASEAASRRWASQRLESKQPAESRPRINKCFVIMPFGGKGEYTFGADEADAVYQEIIKPAVLSVDEDAEVIRQDDELDAGAITSRIVENIAESDLVIVDITGLNANVFFELGIRFSLRRRNTILIHQKTEEIPFDIKVYNSFKYKPVKTSDQSRRLSGIIRDTVTSLRSSDSLVFDTLQSLEVAFDNSDKAGLFYDKKMPWAEYWRTIEDCADVLSEADAEGLYRPNAIVGISNGGSAFADHLSRIILFKGPVVNLWADRNNSRGVFDNGVSQALISGLRTELEKSTSPTAAEEPRLLLVDDIIASGGTYGLAIELLSSAFPNAHIRFLPLFFRHRETIDRVSDRLIWGHSAFVADSDQHINRHTTRFESLPYEKYIRSA